MVEIHAYLKIIYSIHTKNCCIGKKSMLCFIRWIWYLYLEKLYFFSIKLLVTKRRTTTS